MMTSGDRAGFYEQRAARFGKEAEAHAARGRTIGNLRGLSFLAFALLGGAYLLGEGTALGVLSLAALTVFIVLIRRHDVVLAAEEDRRRHAIVNTHARLRVCGRWAEIPGDGSELRGADHPYALDLDLFGPGSLYQRISVARTRYGRARLAHWLQIPASLGEIQARQQAMVELSDQVDLRQTFEAEAMALIQKRRGSGSEAIASGSDPTRLLTWVQEGQQLPGGAVVTVLSFLLPVSTLAGAVAHGMLDWSPLAWAVPLVAGVGVLYFARAATSETFAAVSTTEGAFLRYGKLLALLEAEQPESAWLAARIDKLADTKGRKPSAVMGRFAALVGWYDLRHNGMVYPFVNAALLWDIHCTRALASWRSSVGDDLRIWFETLGEFEALSSLAGLLHDECDSCLPEVTPPSEEQSFRAQALGHPLIPCATRVSNDVESLGAGEALLVTGSNMSGKSTFLRALGINAVLAFAGGPTCAKSFVLPLCRLGTSIRISDSLAQGVSHFYAEVQRLASVVERAASEAPVLFLLDEVLHGTNSRERQIGARWVLAELLSRGAFGVVTTHDMELCRLSEPLMSSVRQHHFREQVGHSQDGGHAPGAGAAGSGDEMTFDYKLREGPVTSGNALRLMRRVGLGVPLDETTGAATTDVPVHPSESSS